MNLEMNAISESLGRMPDDTSSIFSVVVIGAGPVGLAAAAHLIEKGERPLVLEAGDHAAASVSSWGHVRLFSPWRYCIDDAARRLLEASGWRSPDPELYPTGKELAEAYLVPLSRLEVFAGRIRTGCEVVSVARFGLDKMKNEGREAAPFVITLRYQDGREDYVLARSVIDASGTYRYPNPLGSSGVYAPGEKAAADRIVYRIPDVHGADRERYAGKRVAVVGGGHSAFNALIELTDLARDASETKVDWIVRRSEVASLYGGEAGDDLPERGALGGRVRRLVAEGRIRLTSGFRIVAVQRGCCGGRECCDITLVSHDGRRVAVDEIVATTGFRPNLAMLSELRLDLHPAVESPTVLAEMIDPNFHSCGTVDPHGAEQLAHPENGFYIVGMKSYGRAPTFLMLTGYEQVRSIACEITGDREGARKVNLVLPETGVCSGDGCCAPPPQRKTFKSLTLLTAASTSTQGACCDGSSDCC